MESIKTGISYFGNRNPRYFVSDLEEIVSHHCSFIVHTFSENDFEYYKETVKELVALTKDAGLECYLDPWGIGRVFGGEAYSSFALKNRQCNQVLPNGEPAPAACLNHPSFRQYMARWIDAAAEMKANVLFWDEPHFFIDLKQKDRFPLWYCSCPSCLEKFQELNSKSFMEATTEEISRFRDICVVDFLTELCDATHNRGIKNAVCLLPFKDAKIGVSEWSHIAEIPSVDIFGTDPYWMFFNKELHPFVGGFAREIKSLSEKYQKEAQIWIQAYRIAAGREEEIKEAIATAYAEGVRNFAAWSYYGTEYMSYIRSDNPQKVWDILGEVYGKLQHGQWE